MLAFLLLLDEAEQMRHFGRNQVVAAQNLAGVVEADLGAEQQPMRLGQAVDCFVREVACASAPRH